MRIYIQRLRPRVRKRNGEILLPDLMAPSLFTQLKSLRPHLIPNGCPINHESEGCG